VIIPIGPITAPEMVSLRDGGTTTAAAAAAAVAAHLNHRFPQNDGGTTAATAAAATVTTCRSLTVAQQGHAPFPLQ
jgi:hypothetical protein